jgi:hypothetical protein
MSRYSATVRFYILAGAYGISIGFLLISAFVGLECLNSESWILGNEYLVWVFGFGIGGLILFSWALIVGFRWRRSNLVVRPDMPDEHYKLLVVSIGSGIALIASQLTGILTVGFSAGTLGVWILLPLTILLWLFSAVRYVLGLREGDKSAGSALLVNSAVICLVAFLYWTNSRIEFGFRWRLSGYEDVVRLVEYGELRANDNGYATLPEDYQWLSDGGEIMIIHHENLTSVIFFTQLGFPGEYYAIAYRSDDSIPENYTDDRCDGGWRVQANIPKWFVCISSIY